MLLQILRMEALGNPWQCGAGYTRFGSKDNVDGINIERLDIG